MQIWRSVLLAGTAALIGAAMFRFAAAARSIGAAASMARSTSAFRSTTGAAGSALTNGGLRPRTGGRGGARRVGAASLPALDARHVARSIADR